MTDTTQIPPVPTPAPEPSKPGVISGTVLRWDRRTVNGFLILGSLVTVVAILLFRAPPPEAKDFLLTLLGLLGGMAKDVVSYDFGSSAGSEKKDDAMIAAAKKEG